MARDYFPGMGQAVADRTINRKGERWGDVAVRVAAGNTAITGCDPASLQGHLETATVLMSGRHLQHGDLQQPSRNLELFSNCSTAIQRSLSFYLLLNGSGVGSSVDDEICIVNFQCMPKVLCTLDGHHADADGSFQSLDDITGRYTLFRVPDSREGWAQALEAIEVAAFQKNRRGETLVLDFSDVRCKGSPIGGMQDRPSSGPVPLMEAIRNIATLRDCKYPNWLQTMWFDHWAAECVLVGGARRAARMVVKSWRDPGVLAFINIKQGGDLWSANNSIGVDAEFWEMGPWAKQVFDAAVKAQYEHGSGEPGFINLDMLQVGETRPTIEQAMQMEGNYQLSNDGLCLRRALAYAANTMTHFMIVNPCGEIRLNLGGAYCVIADVVPFHADCTADAEDAFYETTWALMRTNMLTAMYAGEVERTNRIGVGLTGVHEYAWSEFGLGFRDLVAANDNASMVMMDANGAWMPMPSERALPFWNRLRHFAGIVDTAANDFCDEFGVVMPTTLRTIKPAGCRPWNALVTTNQGVLTLQEVFRDHPANDDWGLVAPGYSAIQDSGSSPMTQTFANGVAEVFRVQMAYGLAVESTANHPWFVLGHHKSGAVVAEPRWVETKDLKPGDVLDVKTDAYRVEAHHPLRSMSMFSLRMRGNTNPIIQPTEMNEDLSWLLGYLWGDGAMSPTKYRLRWTDQRTVNLEKANRILEDQFGISGTISRLKNKDAYSLEVGNVELWHWLINNGCYKYHADSIDHIPEMVRRSSWKDILAFIAGLIDADGAIISSAPDKSVVLTQMDEAFCRHLHAVAWSVGACFGWSHNTVGDNWQQHRKSMYLLTLGADTHIDALNVLIKHSTKMGQADQDLPQRWRYDRPGRARRRIKGKIEAITSIGKMPTYDVEVADTHWFYAGAVKSHNTTSKLFGLTEGVHLPPLREYVRWVQFRSDDPLVAEYAAKGYPTRELVTYGGTTIVGFPTQPVICALGMGDALITASEATPEEQFRFLRLLETYWLGAKGGNQVSYTLKYDRNVVDFDAYRAVILENMPLVRAVSVMPNTDTSHYEYLPETAVSAEEFLRLVASIEVANEEVDKVHLDCSSGACPIDFKQREVA